MPDALTSEAAAPELKSDLAEVALSAEAARDALIRLSIAARKVPGVKINLARPIELMEQLAERARRPTFRTDAEAEDSTVRSLTASLAALQASGSPLGPEKSAELEKQIRRALAKENGARGGKKMTDRKRAALSRLHESRRAGVGKRDVAAIAEDGDVGAKSPMAGGWIVDSINPAVAG